MIHAPLSVLVTGSSGFIGTNPDKTLPIPGGLAPGAGAIIAAVQAATDCVPVVIGKPDPKMYLLALKRMGLQASEVMAVGDRLETDIAGGQRIGCKAGLVLSGVTTLDQARAWQPRVDCIAEDLSSLLGM